MVFGLFVALDLQKQCATVNAHAKALREQHASLLRQHIELAAYAETLEAAALEAMQLAPASAAPEPDQDRQDQICKSPGGSFSAARAGSGRRSPFAGPFALAAAGETGLGYAAAEQDLGISRSLSCSRLVLAGLPPIGRSRCTTPSPRTSSAAYSLAGLTAALSRKLSSSAVPCSWADRGSGTISPVCGLAGAASAKPPAGHAASALAAGAPGAAVTPGGTKARNSDDTPDTAHDRIPTSHPLITASREADQYDQQPSTGVPLLGVLGPAAGLKVPSRLMMQRVGSLTGLGGKIGMSGGWGDGWRPDCRGTIEAAMQQLEALEAMPL